MPAYRQAIAEPLPSDRVTESAVAYRRALEQHRCNILSERKNPDKAKVSFIFRSAKSEILDDLERGFESGIEPALRGTIDWGVD